MIHHGDCLDILKTLPDNSVDSMVTDPPAGIAFMNKSWDADKGGRTQWIAWMKEIMQECLRVMKPGAHGLIWALPRTSHWTATALEDAGFEVRDVVNHIFGSGFPKNLNVYKSALKQDLICVCKEHEGTQYQMHDVQDPDLQASLQTEEHEKSILQHGMQKQILSKSGESEQILWGEESLLARREVHRTGERLCDDQNAGSSESEAERICIGTHCSDGKEVRQIFKGSGRGPSSQSQSLRQSDKESETIQRSQRALGRASQTGLHCCQCGKLKKEKTDGLGSSLKPAHENWILVRKPLECKTVAENILEWGCGGINIDASRISGTKRHPGDYVATSAKITSNNFGALDRSNFDSTQGRFPANFILSHNDDCELLGEKKVKSHNPDNKLDRVGFNPTGEKVYGKGSGITNNSGYASPDGTETVSDYACSDGCAVAELDRQSLSGGMHNAGIARKKEITSDANADSYSGKFSGTRQVDRFGDSGGASRFFYVAKASKKDKGELNSHSTVKNTKLMSYLITLVTPPNGIVLDPFMGSGSTGVAALRDEFEFIGIEKEFEYFEIAKARIEHVSQQKELMYGNCNS